MCVQLFSTAGHLEMQNIIDQAPATILQDLTRPPLSLSQSLSTEMVHDRSIPLQFAIKTLL